MKVYVVCEDHGYDGFDPPKIATLFKKEAYRIFKKLVDNYREDNHPPSVYLFEYDEEKEVKTLAFWNRYSKDYKTGATGEAEYFVPAEVSTEGIVT